jgi:hypothetical protein
MSLYTLRSDLEERRSRAETFRDFIRVLDDEDRRLFFQLARNRPGPGPMIDVPERNGFVLISDALGERELANQLAKDADDPDSRLTMFSDIISLIHKLSGNYSVYIGRTYYRAGEQGMGILQRWRRAKTELGMQYAMCLARVPRSRVLKDEALGIALVKCWEYYDSLCCNNSVLNAGGAPSDDRYQLLYLCIKRKRGT